MLSEVCLSASSGPAQDQCNKWFRKRLSWVPYDVVPLSQQITAFIEANGGSFAKKEDISSPKHAPHPPSRNVMGYWRSAEGFFKESWTALSKQELADKACRKRPKCGRNCSAHPAGARARWSMSRGRRWRWCANMSTWCMWRMLQRTFGANFMDQNAMSSELPYFEIDALF